MRRLTRCISPATRRYAISSSIQAPATGASGRTLARLFVSETGLTFGSWRKRLLLQEAINRLDRGAPVTAVAFELGYQSLSAFIEMFRKELGVSPRQYARMEGGGNKGAAPTKRSN